MRSIFLLSLLSIFASAFTLNLSITNLKNTQGKLFIGLYNKKENFPIQSKIYKGEPVKITSMEPLQYQFTQLLEGEYAIAIFHDENGNQTLDTNFVGMPTEGYGFSNNVRKLFSAPSFEEAKFSVQDDMNLSIRIGY